MTNGRAKGAVAEREVAALFESWWRRLEPACVFHRTPLSGGWSHAKEFAVAGDLVTNARLFPFCVEVKRNEAWSQANLFGGKRSPVWRWWDQAVRQASAIGKEPLLVWRKNRWPWMTMRRMGVRPFVGAVVVRRPSSTGLVGIVWVSHLDTILRGSPGSCLAPTLRRR